MSYLMAPSGLLSLSYLRGYLALHTDHSQDLWKSYCNYVPIFVNLH